MTEEKMKIRIRVADEVWIATALLHREHPEQPDFSRKEIVERAEKADLTGRSLRPGVYVHADQHCVANRPPNRGRYRMPYETASGRRRLFRGDDKYHSDREDSKITPNPKDLPDAYHFLLEWYRRWASGRN